MRLTYEKPNVFSEALMDRGPFSISAPVLFAAALAVTMIAAVGLLLLPTMWKTGAVLFSLIPLAITVCGIVSCITAEKPSNITLLWVIIMILAPFFGPLLWFAWGRKNT